jgi:hypothetical protein
MKERVECVRIVLLGWSVGKEVEEWSSSCYVRIMTEVMQALGNDLEKGEIQCYIIANEDTSSTGIDVHPARASARLQDDCFGAGSCQPPAIQEMSY